LPDAVYCEKYGREPQPTNSPPSFSTCTLPCEGALLSSGWALAEIRVAMWELKSTLRVTARL
jgi:hypothetical protein